VLDLGSGIGSVALAAAWRLPRRTSSRFSEAQERSVRLARKTVPTTVSKTDIGFSTAT
jgi:16S rRNA G1207 methylase RsmC